MRTKKQKRIELLVSKFLKECRLAAGYSQQNVAEKIGCSKQFVSNWERGQCLPSPKQIPTLNKMFKLQKNELAELVIHAKTLDLRSALK